MTRTSRRLAVSAGLAVLLLSGCGDGQLRPGAAALVGDEKITTADLQRVVDEALVDPQARQELGQDRAAFQRQSLDTLVKRRVLAAAAAERGVSVTEGDVAAELARIIEGIGSREQLVTQAAQGGIPEQGIDTVVRDLVLTRALGDVLVEDVEVPLPQLQAAYQQGLAQYDRRRSRHILVADEATARRVLAEVQRDPSRFAALAAELSTDASNKDTGGDLGVAPRGQFVPEFEKVLFALPEGGYGLAKTEFGFHVINSVEVLTTSLAQARPELRRMVLQQEITTATSAALVETADRLGITVNPRFGTWDPQAGSVVADEDPNDVLVDPSTAPAAPLDPGAPADPGAADPGAPAAPGAPADPGAPPAAPPAS